MIEIKVPKPPTLEDIRKNRKPIRNVRTAHAESLKPLEKFAIWMTNRVGTMAFFFFCVILVTVPLIYKPSMTVIQYISSGYLQLILLPLIMVGQNLQSRAADLRAENDYEINIKAEREVEVILHHLEYQNSILIGMVQKMGYTLEEVEALARTDQAHHGKAAS
ncbi:MAG TPA: DUF1003 domain-containing protein [Armatimonadota bacterium]|jgi:hypothetical protein